MRSELTVSGVCRASSFHRRAEPSRLSRDESSMYSLNCTGEPVVKTQRSSRPLKASSEVLADRRGMSAPLASMFLSGRNSHPYVLSPMLTITRCRAAWDRDN